jgi:hypothetical protein
MCTVERRRENRASLDALPCNSQTSSALRDLRLSSQFGVTCEMLASARNVLDCAHATLTPPFVN